MLPSDAVTLPVQQTRPPCSEIMHGTRPLSRWLSAAVAAPCLRSRGRREVESCAAERDRQLVLTKTGELSIHAVRWRDFTDHFVP